MSTTVHPGAHLLTRVGVAAAHPAAFLIVLGFTGLWIVFDRESFDWHGVATIATWIMTLLIQRAEHRDTQAIHAKLDELLRVEKDASTDLADVDQKEPEEIENQRDSTRSSKGAP